MRLPRHVSALLALALLLSTTTAGPVASAQTSEEAVKAAEQAERRANVASGLVDEAVANRAAIEVQLVESITRLNDLAAQLSLVGSDLDRVASQVGFADVELAKIEADIEVQAVDAYMTVLASPSISLVNSDTVERALVAGSVVEDVVAEGRVTVGQLHAKRKDLVELQEAFLADQDRYRALEEAIAEEVANYTSLFEQADAQVAAAITEAESANREYLDALSAVELAQAKEEERRRQEERAATTTTTSPPSTKQPGGSSPTTTSPPPPPTTQPPSGGGGGSWDHPPEVERWRGLVEQFFPSSRVEEALRIIDCESNGDPNALNPFSGAGGLFQFLPSTWETTSPKAGYAGYSVFDPEANIASAAWLADRYQDLGYYYWSPWSCRRVLA